MGKKAAQMPKLEDEDQVKLKPILGIRPGVYLTFLYSFILLLILFFLLVFPGLRNPGAILIVKSNPQGAGIRVNDVYMGSSGSRIFLPKGSYTIQAVMPGFNSTSAVHEIPSRVFGSLFFPRIYNVELKLTTEDIAGAFAYYAGEFAAWSFGGEPTEAWQIPLSLSEGAYRIGGSLRENPAAQRQLQEILTAASRFTVTRAALRDITRAKILLDNHGLAPSPISLLGSISDILKFLSDNPGSASWLAGLLPAEASSTILSSSWGNIFSTPLNIFSSQETGVLERISIGGTIFREVPSGVLTGGPVTSNRMSHAVDVSGFLIAENPVSRQSFEAFLTENPQWTEHLTDYFPEEISVIPAGSYEREIITGITWYAAEAFCQWLTSALPPSMADMEVRLAKEIEWEYAALSGIVMGDPGWEWCADPFAPLQFIRASGEAILTAGSPEKTLRTSSGRASLPPEFSSPFVTFRPVIAPKE